MLYYERGDGDVSRREAGRLFHVGSDGAGGPADVRPGQGLLARLEAAQSQDKDCIPGGGMCRKDVQEGRWFGAWARSHGGRLNREPTN